MLEEDKRTLKLVRTLLGHPIYHYQADILTCKDKKRIILKGRQIGISTLLAVEALKDSLINPGNLVLLLSIDEPTATELLKKIRSFLRNIPGWESLIGETDKQRELQFANGSRIISLTSNPKNARGYTADHVVLDEFASMEEIDEVFAACLPTLSRGGKLTVASTPKGKSNRFYDLWIQDNNYTKFEIPWWKCPDITEETIEEYRDELSVVPGAFEQEYECSFDVYVGSLWSMAELEQLTSTKSKPGGVLCLGWDPAVKRDKSAVAIVQLRQKKKTVILTDDLSHMAYRDQARKIMQYTEDFKIGRVCVDAGGPGALVIDEHLRPIKAKIRPVHFSNKLKQQMAIAIKADCEKERFEIVDTKFSSNLKAEMMAFDVKDPKFKNINGSHSDFLAALMLAYTLIRKPTPVGYIQFDPRGYTTEPHKRTYTWS